MKSFHICDISSKSGIAKYATDFHRLVLEPLGYELISPSRITYEWLAKQSTDTRWHIQLGALQFEERKALSRIYKSNMCNVDATLHDPPFLTFPYFQFSSPLLMKLSRGFDWYFRSFGQQKRALQRLNKVFVLTEKGRIAIEQMRVNDVQQIPHIVSPASIWQGVKTSGNNIVYFGFIGRAKGLDYALMLHERILQLMPEVKMHVVGQATGPSEQAFLQSLKQRFHRHVTYHGFVAEDVLDELFSDARHIFLPFKPYSYFYPASGSVINGLKRGRIVWSTPVNSVSELIKDGVNGLFLTGNIETDCAKFLDISSDTTICERISNEALDTARLMSVYPYTQHFS